MSDRGRPFMKEPACLISSRSLARGGPGGLACFMGSPVQVDIRVRHRPYGRAFVALGRRMRCLAPPFRGGEARCLDLEICNRRIDTCASLRAGCARFGRAGWSVTAHTNHPLRRPARSIEPRRGREDATSAFKSEEPRPGGSEQRCHSPPFSAERPLVTNADRSALRAHFLGWLIAPAFDEP